MRDLYIKDENKLFRSVSCNVCGADKLTPTKKSFGELKKLVSNDIAYVMPMMTITPDEGITYECKCHDQDNYSLVEKEIPLWVDKRVYELKVCPNCKAEGTITVHPVGDEVSDTAHDLELQCSRCHVSTNLSKVSVSERTEAQVQQDWNEYEKHLVEKNEEEIVDIPAKISKAVKFEKITEPEDMFFDIDAEYTPAPTSGKKPEHEIVEEDDDFEISLDMDIEI